ncbi:MAG: outer membrane beta-barrel protein [Hyphomicrobium sp.]|uniref:outer membrane protein n=1 Tax=Hyphomicrobium sp. TaxID=82 RepID=UPI0039E71463
MFRIIAAAFLCLFGASAAYAGGDLTDYAAPLKPVSACGGPFSGLYGGGILGFGSAKSKISGEGGSIDGNDRGFTIGGTAGYNWQCNGRLLGIESDISYFNADNKWSESCCGGFSETLDSQINWFGTLRGRVGLVGDENFLVFATAGLAYGGIDHSFKFQGGEIGSFSQSDSDTEIGWTVGGGVEYLLSDHWAFRADALYVDFGSEDHTYTTDLCESGSCTSRLSWDDNFWVARVGLTYLFGGAQRDPAPEYAPMK